jgi:tripartite-type tricarboxylate transporter receptor subunit TctC
MEKPVARVPSPDHLQKLFALVAAIAMSVGTAHAQAPNEFYRGKQIRLVIGNSVGAEYDLGGRLVARHLGRHIPGHPGIVVQNMQGAAGILASNYLYNAAPRDGTVVGAVSRNIPIQAMLGRDNLKADPRQFGWIGGSGLASRVCYVAQSSPITRPSDLFERELVVGGAGAGSSLSFVPIALHRVLHMKFRLVEGYRGVADAVVALQRGEIEGICHTYNALKTTQAALLRNRQIRLLLRAEETPLADGTEVPSIYEYVSSEQQRQILRFIFSAVEFGRPYFAPPGVPQDRIDVLRRAFAAVHADPEFRAEAESLQLDVDYRPPAALQQLVDDLFATPKELVAQAKAIMPAPGD